MKFNITGTTGLLQYALPTKTKVLILYIPQKYDSG